MTHITDHLTPPITLTTDFGLRDAYVASMKGVILNILPVARIIDISHEIEAQNIIHAAFVLASATPFFPLKTVHVVVVDPGVGTKRRAIAVFTDKASYIGPDNGVFTLVYKRERVKEIRLLSNRSYGLPVISDTFHGRDIFAPFAAHLAAGASSQSLGPEVTDPVVIDLPEPQWQDDNSLKGQIIYTDHFGNLVSNIPVSRLEDSAEWLFSIGGIEIKNFYRTYGDADPGQILVLAGSSGLIEVAVRNGSAARHLGVQTGDPLVVSSRQL